MKKHVLLAALMAALSGGAMAQAYMGVDVGSTKIDDLGSKSSFGIYGGYAFSKTMAAELGYRKLGTYDVLGVPVKASSIQLSGILGAEVKEGFVVYGRLGMNQLKAAVSGFGSDTSTKVLWGLGMDAKLSGNTAARIEYQKPASDTGTLSVGLKFSF